MPVWKCEECGALNDVLLGPGGGPPPALPMDLGVLRCTECGHDQRVVVRAPGEGK